MEQKELIEKYNVNIEKLEQEQLKLAKTLDLKDIIEFSDVNYIGAIENIMVKGQIISAAIVCNKDYEIVEQEYFIDKLRFPYLHGFRAYRELPTMTAVYNKIREKPDIMLIKGKGINHSRLGIASHFSLLTGVPTIGVTDKNHDETEVKGDDVFLEGKKVGNAIITKKGSKPLFISPGNKISIASSYDAVQNMIVPPHKLPEPLHLAHRYAKDIKKELKIN